MDETKQKSGTVEEQPKQKTAAEKKKEQEKVPSVVTPLPERIVSLVGRVASSKMEMRQAREELRAWVSGLTELEKDQLKLEADQIGRRMVAAAEGLSQELTILVASL